MDIKQPGFTRFSRFGDNLGRIHVISAIHTEGLDGTDTLEVTCTEDLAKNDYIVWMDRRGEWHEHIVDTHERTHDDTGAPLTVATCINSINETWDDYITDVRPSGSVQTALSSILAPTRWEAGICTQTGVASHTFYHKNVRECLQELVKTWGGELETAIASDGSKVTSRTARVMSARGNQLSPKRFTWTKDLVSIRRTVESDNPKSRIYAYGKGEETDSGGYGRRIGIEDVNGGLPYVEDADATQLWGHPMPNGTIAPACGVFVDEECTDPAILLAEALEALDAAKVPKVSYTADVLDLASFGRDWEDVALGDTVTIIDKEFSEEGIRIRGRVSKLERDLLTYDTTITFGNLVDAMSDLWEGVHEQLSSITQRTANWDLASEASPNWLDLLFSSLNAKYEQVGTYHYSSFEQGEIWSNVPLDEYGHATQSGGWAMNINGLGFRLASSLNADGSWNWRAFGTGEGFSADEMVTGTLKSILIRDLADNGNCWNLATGDFQLAATAQIGSKTVAQVVNVIDATITGVDVQYAQGTSATVAPSSGWQSQPPAWEAGKYIWTRTATTTAAGTTYSTPAMISGKDGADGTSVNILGSYNTLAELQAAHPTGSMGDGYIVAGDLYVWNGSAWEDVGTIQGPQGPAGTSVTVSSIQYGTSNSASTQPSSWSTTAPTSLTKGKWLWVKTNYSTGSTAVSKTYIGTDGEDGTSIYVTSSGKSGGVTTVHLSDGTTLTINDGEDGANGTAGLNGYVHVAWANSSDGTADFSTTVSAGKSYLGVYTDNTAADSTNPSAYSWSKIEGEQGEDGLGITSIVEQYYLSTSSSAITGGSWATTPQAYVSGRYYWTRSQITWDDGSVTTTSPVLSRGLNSANDTAARAKSTIDTLNTQEGVFNKLTNNGQLQGLYMQNGQLYINGTYMKMGKITSTNGKVYFDLDNNELVCSKVKSASTSQYMTNTVAEIQQVQLGTYYAGGLMVYNNEYGSTPEDGSITISPRASDSTSTLAYPSIKSDGQLRIATNGSFGPEIMLSDGNMRLRAYGSSGYETSLFLYGSNAGSSSASKLDVYTRSGTRFYSNLTVMSGYTKSKAVETDSYGTRLLYCDENPSPTFTDFGSGTIGEDGICYVEIDDVFSETVRTDMAYQVFLQACGEGDLWIAEKHQNYFVVEGTPNLAFDWQLKAKQRNFEFERLDDMGVRSDLDGAGIADLDFLSVYDADLDYAAQIEAIYETEESDEAA